MQRQEILHQTIYRYSEPVSFGVHRLVLRPREGHQLKVLRHQLTVKPQADLFWYNDIYGNNVALAEFDVESDSLEVSNQIIIETTGEEDHAGHRRSRPSLSPLPVFYSQMETAVVQGYQQAVYPEDHEVVRQWLINLPGYDNQQTALGLASFIAHSIYTQIVYRRREEAGVQTPSETLRSHSGSCRDMAVLMIEACRVHAVAARFVSGYLDSAASAAARGSTHAWAEVYLPDNGWTGFDPTSGRPVSHKHIAIGVSAHPRGVMPISGSYHGRRGSYLGMNVTVSVQPWLEQFSMEH